jgi:hypothetical protein
MPITTVSLCDHCKTEGCIIRALGVDCDKKIECRDFTEACDEM